MSVRILRGSALPSVAAPRSAHPAFVATARKIEAAAYQAEVDATKVRARANDEAAKIIAAAHEKARSIEAAADRAAKEKADQAAFVALAKVRAEEARVVERACEVAVGAARAVAERAIGKAIADDDATLAAWVREALVPLRAARRIALRAHRATIERLRRSIAELSPNAAAIVDLVADDALALDVVVARSDLGELRLDPSIQASQMIAVVRDAIEAAVKERAQ